MTRKEEFVKIVASTIKRDGISELMSYLENETDFFTAPASTKYHNSFEGGLVDHSLNVYSILQQSPICGAYSAETIALVSLFHDLCKANTTVISTRRQLNEETNKWETVPYYETKNKFPFGHGEKSVYLLMKYIKLTDEEALAINWHMGGYDERAKGYDLSQAMNLSPLVVELHIADLRATFITENKNI